MNVIQTPIENIKPYGNNPRYNNSAVSRVAMSISQFGFQQPIVVDKDFVVIAGHTRLRAAQELKLSVVPVVIADLAPEKARAYRIADNRVAEHSDWDVNLLKVELTGIESELGSLELTDFNWDEFNLLAEPEIELPKDKEKDARPGTKKKANLFIFKNGEVWDFGGNELKVTNDAMSPYLAEMARAFEEYSSKQVTRLRHE